METVTNCNIEPIEIIQKYYYNAQIIGGVGIFTSVLSLAGSLSVIGYTLSKHVCFDMKVKPLFHLTCADLLLSLCWISSSWSFLHTLDEFKNEIDLDRALVCFVWQLITQVVHMCTFFLTLNYSFHVFHQMKKRVQNTFPFADYFHGCCFYSQSWLHRFFYIVAWFLPVVLLIPIMLKTKSSKIDSCKECILLIDIPMLKNDGLSDYGYIVWIASLSLVILLITLFYLLTLRLYWNATPGFHTNRERRRFQEMQLRISCYIFVFVLCWTPSLIIASVKWYDIKKHEGFDVKKHLVNSFPIYVIQAICAPLQGFLNSLVYGWTRKSFRNHRLVEPRDESRNSMSYNSIPSNDEINEAMRTVLPCDRPHLDNSPLGY